MTVPSVLGNAAQVFYNLASSGSYTEITNIHEVGTPNPEVTEVNMSSLNDAIDVRIPGSLDNKEFTFTAYHIPATFTVIFTTLMTVNPVYWKITFSDTHGFTFQGFIKSAKGKLDRNQALMWEVTVAISGALVEL